jgi:hypothetical protein
MRIVALHDSAGNIISLIALPPDGTSAGLQVGPGQSLTELDIAEIPDDLAPEETYERLVEITQRFRVDTKSSRPGIVRRDADQY